ncbi:unnamed protein product [Rotaria sp. Silwood1]|nr:unnamed protein product [Rotaria sp. Silwood1]
MLSLVLPAIAKLNLRKLFLKEFDFNISLTSWSIIQCPIKHLTIDECKNVNYRIILNHLPHLQIFVMRHCINNDDDNNPQTSLSDHHTSEKPSGKKKLIRL